jgi:hypothetical protein
LKAWPTTPTAYNGLVTAGFTKLLETTNERVADPLPIAFVALIVTGKVPVAVGVPEMMPVEESKDSPAGSPVLP